MSSRRLIVNADDFGQSPGINRGVIQAHRHGIVTSASLMVRWAGAAEAAAYNRRHPDLSLGLHLDFGEWAYRAGTWVAKYEVVPLDDPIALLEEANRQLAAFHALLGKQPTHLDSHQHVHRREPARSVLIELARRISVPLRHCNPDVRFCGAFYGQTELGEPLSGAVSVEGLTKILDGLGPGITELSCHPGIVHDLNTVYRQERAKEVEVLCDPRIRSKIAASKIKLCSFCSLLQAASGPIPAA